MSDKALPPLPPGEIISSTDRPIQPTRTPSESDRFISDFTHGTIIQSAPPSYISRSAEPSIAPKYTRRPTDHSGTRQSSTISRLTTSQTTLDDRSSIASSSSSAEDSERAYDDDEDDVQIGSPTSTLAPSEEDHEDDLNEPEWNDENKDKARTWMVGGEGGETRADMRDDGRIDIKLNLKKTLPPFPPDYFLDIIEPSIDPSITQGLQPAPHLRICILIVGSRGDVQPYLSLALTFILRGGHTVRLCTHGDFKEFVLGTGRRVLGGRYEAEVGQGRRPYIEGEKERLCAKLQFFDIGGSPKELMAYMVKNPGLLPGYESILKGDIGKKQKMVKQMLHSFYLSTFSPDQETGTPFAVDAIISNPPAFAAEHLAEMGGIPLVMSFTMPWSPTTEFNHPLVNVSQSNADQGVTNYLTFGLAEAMTWQGLGGIINRFRRRDLHLDRLQNGDGPALADRLKLPYMYCWSPTVIPKPFDWSRHIDVVGYFFLDDSEYDPDPKLAAFLAAGPPPVYIGFGSVVVDDPAALTATIFGAIERTGIRALVSAGWSEIGGDNIPDNVFLLGNVPHDWLFAEGRVAAVCHHGGAGTTAIGLKNGLPTIVVPFFGDQPFQGAMVARAGAGPEPIPFKYLNVDTLSWAIDCVMGPDMKIAAAVIGRKIQQENGEETAVKSFYKHVPFLNMHCDIVPGELAIWKDKRYALRLSAVAAATIVQAKKRKWRHYRPNRPKEYETAGMDMFPLAGGVNSMLRLAINSATAAAELFYKPHMGIYHIARLPVTGLFSLMDSVYSGLESMPRFWGSETRVVQPKGIWNGFAEGGKGFAYGLADGIGGLVTKPLKGAKEDGWTGAGIGLARGLADVAIKPVAGVMALVFQPARGTYNSAIKSSRKRHDPYVRPKRELSMLALNQKTPEQQKEILVKFKALKKTRRKRRRQAQAELNERLAERQKAAEAVERDMKEKLGTNVTGFAERKFDKW